ncbi:MAG: DUF3775 domain-containing protein [Isosphaeraceae bacterium]
MKPRHPGRATADQKRGAKLSEVIPELLRLFEERSDYYDNELPKLYKDYPLVSPGEEPESPPAPQDAQLRQILMKLPPDKLYQLIVIMYLSRSYYSTSDLADLFEEIKGDFDEPESVMSFIVGLGSFARSLMGGLAKLENARIDVDDLDQVLRKPTRVRK